MSKEFVLMKDPVGSMEIFESNHKRKLGEFSTPKEDGKEFANFIKKLPIGKKILICEYKDK